MQRSNDNSTSSGYVRFTLWVTTSEWCLTAYVIRFRVSSIVTMLSVCVHRADDIQRILGLSEQNEFKIDSSKVWETGDSSLVWLTEGQSNTDERILD